MVRPLDGSRPRLAVAVPSSTKPSLGDDAALTESPGRPPVALGAVFDDARKKLLSLGRTNTRLLPVHLDGAPPAGTLQLKELVRGGTATATQPKLDASGKAALEVLKKDKSPMKSLAFQEATNALSPEQRVAVARALPKDVRAAMMKDIMRAPEQMMGATAVAFAQSLSKDELKVAAAAIRANPPSAPGSIHLAISAELAASTPWGKQHPKNLERLREGIANATIEFKADRGGALTEMRNKANLGKITVDPTQVASPEGLAATLAHESQHSLNAINGAKNSPLEEETQGNAAGAAVFAAIGNPNDPNLPVDDRKAYAEYKEALKHGEDGVAARVGAWYSKFASEEFAAPGKARFQDENRAFVNTMATDLTARPKAAANLTADHAEKLVTALFDVTANTAAEQRAGGKGQDVRVATAIDTMAAVFKHAKPAALAAARAQIQRESGADGLARFDAAIKK